MTLRPPPDEDELLTAAGMPHWVRWVVGIGAVGLVVGLGLVKARDESPTPSASPSTAASAAETPHAVAPITVPIAGARRVILPTSPQPPDDVAVDSDTTLVLQGSALLSRPTGGDWQSVSLERPPASGGQATLVLDPAEHRVWVVALGAPRSTLQAYDTQTLRWIVSITWPREVVDAAAVRGSLYVADPSGLSRAEPNGTVAPIEIARGQRILDLAADPLRGRALMLLADGSKFHIAEVGSSSVTVSSPAPDGLVKGWLGVTGLGQIWAAGFGQSGAVLVRLDPASLRTVAVSPLSNQVGPGALLVATGYRSLFIGSGSGASSLWCLDDRDGGPMQRWSMVALRGASSREFAYAVVSSGLVRLDIEGRCTG